MKLIDRMVLTAWLVCLSAVPAGAVVTGMVDTFSDGTFQGWGGAVDANVPTDGPAGAGDRFLQASSGSLGSTPNLAVFTEEPRWQGDYTSAGAGTFSADVKVLDGPLIELRAVLFGGGTGASRATSTTALSIPADGQWHHVSFDITAAGLTLVFPFDPLDNLLANVNRIMLRHQSGPPATGGSAVSAVVGFDNIAITPEPTGCICCLCGIAVTMRRRRGRGVETRVARPCSRH